VLCDADETIRYARAADALFPSASAIKVPLVMALYAEAARGAIDLDQCVGVGERVAGSGVLTHLRDIRELTLRDHATLTIVVSDNTATNRLMDRVGLDLVNAYLDRWGCPRTRLRRRMFDLKARERGLENEMTPRESARLLAILLRGELVDRATSDAVLEILHATAYDGLARRYLPNGVWTANKTGQLENVRNDIGFVRVDRPVIFAAFTAELESIAEGEAALGLAGWFAYREAGGNGPELPPLVA
jgi:beta-lactamase class A